MNASHSLLQLQGLSFGHPDQKPLASGWNASVGPGVTRLFGDTGSGKTTLLHVIAGTLPALAGHLTLAGARLDTAREAYRRNVFFCDPTSDQHDPLTVLECTTLLSKGDNGFDADSWQALVEGFSLTPHLEKKMFMLSTGSKRKVWMAAGFASSRALVLLDEPTAGLDAASTRCLWSTLAGFDDTGKRAVLVASAARVDAVALAATIELPPR